MKINKVFKIGRSWSVAIPRGYFESHDINPGDYVTVETRSNRIEIRKLRVSKGRKE